MDQEGALQFDDRDFTLVALRETRKVWAEKFLGVGPTREEGDHFRLYRSCQAALGVKIQSESAKSFTCQECFDVADPPAERVKDLSHQLDSGAVLINVRVKVGLYQTLIPAIEKGDGALVVHTLSMGPIPSVKDPSEVPAGFAANLIDRLLAGKQPAVGIIRPQMPDLSGMPGFYEVGAFNPSDGHRRFGERIIETFNRIAESPLEAPSEGRIYPPLDYGSFSDQEVTRAAVLQRNGKETWRELTGALDDYLRRGEPENLDSHQMACAQGFETVKRPYVAEFQSRNVIAFACSTLAVDSCLAPNRQSLLNSPRVRATPVMECFMWREGGLGLVVCETVDLFDIGHNQDKVEALRGRLIQTGYKVIAADEKSCHGGTVMDLSLWRASALLDNDYYHHPASLLDGEEVPNMVFMLGGRRISPRELADPAALMTLAKALSEKSVTELDDTARSRWDAERRRLEQACEAVFKLCDLAETRARAAIGLVPAYNYGKPADKGFKQWAAFEPAVVTNAVAAHGDGSPVGGQAQQFNCSRVRDGESETLV